MGQITDPEATDGFRTTTDTLLPPMLPIEDFPHSQQLPLLVSVTSLVGKILMPDGSEPLAIMSY